MVVLDLMILSLEHVFLQSDDRGSAFWCSIDKTGMFSFMKPRFGSHLGFYSFERYLKYSMSIKCAIE